MRNDRSLLGEPAVYPGHPVTIAYLIMEAYKDFKAATAKTEHGYADALASSDIPGAGGEVSNAIELLRQVVAGRPVDEVVREREACWSNGQAGGHPNNVLPGQQQADHIKPKFYEKLREWIVPENPEAGPETA